MSNPCGMRSMGCHATGIVGEGTRRTGRAGYGSGKAVEADRTRTSDVVMHG